MRNHERTDLILYHPPHKTEDIGSSLPSTGRRFQFSLRTLLLGMSLLSVLFAAMSAMGPIWSILVGWCAVLVFAHVAGMVWGERVRRLPALPEPDDRLSARPRTVPVEGFAPGTRLRENAAPGGPMIFLTCLGAAAGGAVGSYLLWKPLQPWTFYPGYVVGVASASIVGGFLGYLAGSFIETALSAWREAAGSGTAHASRVGQQPQ
ncbi:MAG: hypothetical protein AB7O62_25940 [Pirellulales bacterium]